MYVFCMANILYSDKLGIFHIRVLFIDVYIRHVYDMSNVPLNSNVHDSDSDNVCCHIDSDDTCVSCTFIIVRVAFLYCLFYVLAMYNVFIVVAFVALSSMFVFCSACARSVCVTGVLVLSTFYLSQQ